MASSMAPLHSLGRDDRNEVQHDFLSCYAIESGTGFMWLMALSMTPQHSLHQDNQNEVQHDFLGHITPIAQISVKKYWYTYSSHY